MGNLPALPLMQLSAFSEAFPPPAGRSSQRWLTPIEPLFCPHHPPNNSRRIVTTTPPLLPLREIVTISPAGELGNYLGVLRANKGSMGVSQCLLVQPTGRFFSFQKLIPFPPGDCHQRPCEGSLWTPATPSWTATYVPPPLPPSFPISLPVPGTEARHAVGDRLRLPGHPLPRGEGHVGQARADVCGDLRCAIRGGKAEFDSRALQKKYNNMTIYKNKSQWYYVILNCISIITEYIDKPDQFCIHNSINRSSHFYNAFKIKNCCSKTKRNNYEIQRLSRSSRFH